MHSPKNPSLWSWLCPALCDLGHRLHSWVSVTTNHTVVALGVGTLSVLWLWIAPSSRHPVCRRARACSKWLP